MAPVIASVSALQDVYQIIYLLITGLYKRMAFGVVLSSQITVLILGMACPPGLAFPEI